MGGGCKVTSRLDDFEQRTRRKAERAMTKMVITIQATAATYTPVDTSNLINSSFKSVSFGPTNVYGRIGYTAEYAAYVHNASGTLKGLPRPKRNGRSQGVFWGPGGEPKFLLKGAKEAEPLLRSILKKEMRT